MRHATDGRAFRLKYRRPWSPSWDPQPIWFRFLTVCQPRPEDEPARQQQSQHLPSSLDYWSFLHSKRYRKSRKVHSLHRGWGYTGSSRTYAVWQGCGSMSHVRWSRLHTIPAICGAGWVPPPRFLSGSRFLVYRYIGMDLAGPLYSTAGAGLQPGAESGHEGVEQSFWWSFYMNQLAKQGIFSYHNVYRWCCSLMSWTWSRIWQAHWYVRERTNCGRGCSFSFFVP